MALKTLNGFWIVETPITGDVHRSHWFWNKKIEYKAGSRISVGAFTRKNKNITRIPFIISFFYKAQNFKIIEEDYRGENYAMQLLSKIFNANDVLCIKERKREEIKHSYIFDDIRICKALRIKHELYLKQFENFLELIKDFIIYYVDIDFKLYLPTEWINLTSNIDVVSVKRVNREPRPDFFFAVVDKLSQGFKIPCKFINERLIKGFNHKIDDILEIFRVFANEVVCMSLYYMHFNLYITGEEKIKDEINYNNKIYRVKKWNCEKDCNYKCGLKSPLHLLSDNYYLKYNEYPRTLEIDQVSRKILFNSILTIFFGCYILQNKSFFINNKQKHLGVLALIVKSANFIETGRLEKRMEEMCKNLPNMHPDIKLSEILKSKSKFDYMNILSQNVKSTFIKSLYSRTKNYNERIAALKDAIPFVSSKYKKRGKLNILQFLDCNSLEKIFMYKPLSERGLLCRAILCEIDQFDPDIISSQTKIITNFCNQTDNNITINLDENEIINNYLYVYNEYETLFTKKSIKDFYITVATIYAIFFSILEGSDNISDNIINISSETLKKACLYANNIVIERDKNLLYLTKQAKLKSLFEEFINTLNQYYIYNRDILRHFSSFDKKLLNTTIIRFIDNKTLDAFCYKNKGEKNTSFIFRINYKI